MNRLKASTVMELLVVMVISSIVLAIVMEGWSVFRLYATSTLHHGQRRSALTHSYMLLESMCYLSDSVTRGDGCLDFYSVGNIKWSLTDRDSILIGMQSIDIRFDSLIVLMAQDGEQAIRFAFPIGISRCSERKDEKYVYEE